MTNTETKTMTKTNTFREHPQIFTRLATFDQGDEETLPDQNGQ